MPTDRPQDPALYKTKCAISDLLSFSGGIGLMLKGIETHLREDELESALSDEQKERFAGLITKLHDAADDVADFARELGEQSRQ
jgi:hypothetical protein